MSTSAVISAVRALGQDIEGERMFREDEQAQAMRALDAQQEEIAELKKTLEQTHIRAADKLKAYESEMSCVGRHVRALLADKAKLESRCEHMKRDLRKAVMGYKQLQASQHKFLKQFAQQYNTKRNEGCHAPASLQRSRAGNVSERDTLSLQGPDSKKRRTDGAIHYRTEASWGSGAPSAGGALKLDKDAGSRGGPASAQEQMQTQRPRLHLPIEPSYRLDCIQPIDAEDMCGQQLGPIAALPADQQPQDHSASSYQPDSISDPWTTIHRVDGLPGRQPIPYRAHSTPGSGVCGPQEREPWDPGSGSETSEETARSKSTEHNTSTQRRAPAAEPEVCLKHAAVDDRTQHVKEPIERAPMASSPPHKPHQASDEELSCPRLISRDLQQPLLQAVGPSYPPFYHEDFNEDRHLFKLQSPGSNQLSPEQVPHSPDASHSSSPTGACTLSKAAQNDVASLDMDNYGQHVARGRGALEGSICESRGSLMELEETAKQGQQAEDSEVAMRKEGENPRAEGSCSESGHLRAARKRGAHWQSRFPGLSLPLSPVEDNQLPSQNAPWAASHARDQLEDGVENVSTPRPVFAAMQALAGVRRTRQGTRQPGRYIHGPLSQPFVQGQGPPGRYLHAQPEPLRPEPRAGPRGMPGQGQRDRSKDQRKQAETCEESSAAAHASAQRQNKSIQVIRGRLRRQLLQAFECPECQRFFECFPHLDVAEVLQNCSRHRSTDAPYQTPEGFWELSFPDSVQEQRDGKIRAKMDG